MTAWNRTPLTCDARLKNRELTVKPRRTPGSATRPGAALLKAKPFRRLGTKTWQASQKRSISMLAAHTSASRPAEKARKNGYLISGDTPVPAKAQALHKKLALQSTKDNAIFFIAAVLVFKPLRLTA